MIDVHSHLLPNVDDGSKTIEETINLLKEAKIAGFNKIIVTPHFKKEQYVVEKDQIHILTDVLMEKLAIKENIGVELIPAHEIYVDAEMVEDLINERTSQIRGTSYILFELPFSQKIYNLEKLIKTIIDNGFTPILAHPERYEIVQKKPELLDQWIKLGVVMQSNYCSILGFYGKNAQKCVKILLKKGYIHLLGSDAHRQGTIYPKIDEAKEKISKIIGEDKLGELTLQNPEIILQNGKIIN